MAPVFVNETVTAKVKIEEIDLDKNKIKLLTECFIENKKILTGIAEIMVSSRAKID